RGCGRRTRSPHSSSSCRTACRDASVGGPEAETEGPVKLALLYEFQPKVKPWDRPHPYGQRRAELQTYDEAFEEIRFADRLGFQTVWCVEHHFRDGRSACPSSEAVLGGLALATENIRLGF